MNLNEVLSLDIPLHIGGRDRNGGSHGRATAGGYDFDATGRGGE